MRKYTCAISVIEGCDVPVNVTNGKGYDELMRAYDEGDITCLLLNMGWQS